MPNKEDINPETGKAYAINPATGLWDDNYWANTVEPSLGGTTPTTTPTNNNYNNANTNTVNMPSGGQMPSKGDINPATGKAYAINPETGVWDDNYWANTVEPSLKAQYGGGGGTSGLPTTYNQPTIDLPGLYESITASSGISDIERDLSAKTDAYNTQVAKIKDNPYLSEATMTGRISKLTDKFNADKANIQNNIAMKKADIETQLNLQMKQFDINSQQAQLAWTQSIDMLNAGMLDNATGADIARLVRATGLSSNMWLSAIEAMKKSKEKPINTSIIQIDDGTNISAVIINSDTGEVINTQIIGASKPEKATGGSGAKAGSGEQLSVAIGDMSESLASYANSYGHLSPADWKRLLREWMSAGLKREDFIKNFGQYADTNRGDFESAYGFENPSY